MALLALLLLGLLIGSLIAGVRYVDSQQWRQSLSAFRLRLPAGVTAEQVAQWLATATALGGSRWRLLDAPPLVLETVATSRGITQYVLVPAAREKAVLASLRAALPGARVEPAPEYVQTRPAITTARELRLTSMTRPLAFERAEATVAAFLANLQPLPHGVEVRTQWLCSGARTPHPSTLAKEQDGLSVLTGLPARDREAIRAERLKHAEPLLRVCGRIGVSGASAGYAAGLLDRLIGSLRLLNAPGVSVERRWLPSWWAAEGLRTRLLPLLNWPMLVNSREASGLVGLPVGAVHLPGLHLGAARQLPPHTNLPSSGAVVGFSNYPGMETQPLALRRTDRLRHAWVVSPTGAGKSTLLANLLLQDVARGDGLVVIDARGDLIPDVLSRIPDSRRDDVILLDPAHTAQPVGFNILQSANKELVVDHVLHVLHDLYRAHWGPRTADILRNCLITLVNRRAADGSAYTLVELPTLLLNPRFRRTVIGSGPLPHGVADFWQWYEQLSAAERANVIGPVMNKLRNFTLKTSLRLMLGQSTGFNFADVFTKRRIVLLPLSKGTLGEETAQLLGSLAVASLWQATTARIQVPAERRRPAWLYADEFQEVVRLPLNFADMLSQARGLGLGVTLSHQYIAQLPEAIKQAVLSTARTHITFQCDYPDATVLARSFAPLTREDLMGLDSYEIALRPCVDGRTLSPVTGVTLPLPPITTDGTALARYSRNRFGVPAADVEQALRSRVGESEKPTGRIGRNDRGASA